MHILGNITDQHVRHAYIMLSLSLSCKAAKRATTTTRIDCPRGGRAPNSADLARGSFRPG
jgi:hypothetical protein